MSFWLLQATKLGLTLQVEMLLSTYFSHQLFSHCPALQHFPDHVYVGPQRLPSLAPRVRGGVQKVSMHQMTSDPTRTWLVNDKTYIGLSYCLDQMDPKIEQKRRNYYLMKLFDIKGL